MLLEYGDDEETENVAIDRKNCEIWVEESIFDQHVHGTAHLVTSKDLNDAVPDPIILNETNIGFRMLRDQGWSYDKGLGINEQGPRHPISTRIKNDKYGIGINPSKIQKLPKEKRKRLNAREAAIQYENDRLKLLASDGPSNHNINTTPITDEHGTQFYYRPVSPNESKEKLWLEKIGKGLEAWLKDFNEFKNKIIGSKLLEFPAGYSFFEHIKTYTDKSDRRDNYLFGGKYRFSQQLEQQVQCLKKNLLKEKMQHFLVDLKGQTSKRILDDSPTDFSLSIPETFSALLSTTDINNIHNWVQIPDENLLENRRLLIYRPNEIVWVKNSSVLSESQMEALRKYNNYLTNWWPAIVEFGTNKMIGIKPLEIDIKLINLRNEDIRPWLSEDIRKIRTLLFHNKSKQGCSFYIQNSEGKLLFDNLMRALRHAYDMSKNYSLSSRVKKININDDYDNSINENFDYYGQIYWGNECIKTNDLARIDCDKKGSDLFAGRYYWPDWHVKTTQSMPINYVIDETKRVHDGGDYNSDDSDEISLIENKLDKGKKRKNIDNDNTDIQSLSDITIKNLPTKPKQLI
ncbi:8461_t:CDS:10 [Entrophospora sp. SA101]|nr:8461_t:CDS:10 [Entrophospora sp. SA101]